MTHSSTNIEADNTGGYWGWKLRAGSDLITIYELEDVNGDTYNLTDYTAACKVYQGTTVIHTLTGVVDEGAGKITVTVTHAISLTLPSSCRYILSITSPADLVYPVAYGNITVITDTPA